MTNQTNKVKLEWSSRHVRLRFQMLVASLVYFCVAKYGFDELSFLPIKFVDEPTNFAVLSGTLAFAIYMIFGFVFRTLNENVSSGIFGEKTLSQLQKTEHAMKDLNNRLDAIPTKLSSIENLPDFEQKILAQLESLKNRLSEISESELSKSIRFDLPDISEINLTLEKYSKHFALGDLDQGKDKMLTQNFDDVSVIIKLLNLIDGQAKIGTSISAYKAAAKQISETLSDTKRFYSKEVKALLEKAGAELLKSQKANQRTLRALNSVNLVHRMERSLLSVWVPVVTSMILIIAGSAEAIQSHCIQS